MHIVSHIAELRAFLNEHRARGGTVGLVPTMGALHAGHLSLVDAARLQASCVVMSIFVNPLQFAPTEDFAAYPRPLEMDMARARERKVDVLFVPTVAEMYPRDLAVNVVPRGGIGTRWEGGVRPDHFAGVLTVVAKLFHIVQPDIAVFGQKDAQQVVLIRAMVRDLNFPLTLVVAPTVREADGLAMSSRNAYLSGPDRDRARVLSTALRAMESQWRQGETRASVLESAGRDVVAGSPDVHLDYLAIAEPERLDPVGTVAEGYLAMVAARVGRTRLIDNVVFTSTGPQ